jgi:hypothetical protein
MPFQLVLPPGMTRSISSPCYSSLVTNVFTLRIVSAASWLPRGASVRLGSWPIRRLCYRYHVWGKHSSILLYRVLYNQVVQSQLEILLRRRRNDNDAIVGIKGNFHPPFKFVCESMLCTQLFQNQANSRVLVPGVGCVPV